MKKTCLLLFLLSCSSGPSQVGTGKPPAPTEPEARTSLEAKQIAAEMGSPYVVEVVFSKGKTGLTKLAQTRIQNLWKSLPKEFHLEQVKVITWADEEYPSEKDKTLPQSQKNLVEARNKEIKNFIQKVGNTKEVELHSMAKRPNTFQEFLGSVDSRIKKSLEFAGISTTDENQKTKSMVSKSIIMAVPEEKR